MEQVIKRNSRNWFIKFLMCDGIFKFDGKPRKLKKQFLPLWWLLIVIAIVLLGFFGYYFCKAWMWMVDFVNYVVWGMMPPVW